MYNLIAIFLFLLLVSIYIVYKQKKNDKYNNSPINLLIERAYSNWYSVNGRIINKKYSTVYEFDKVQLTLKEELISKGITDEDLKKYLEFLKNKTDAHFTSRDWFVTISSGVGSLGLTTIFKGLFPSFQLPTFDELVKFFSNKEIVSNIKIGFFLVLLAIILVIFSWIMFKIAKIDVFYKDRQRIFLLERLTEIWSYRVNEEVSNLEDVIKLEQNKKERDTVYKKIEFTRTKFEKMQSDALGETLYDNFLFFHKVLKIERIKKIVEQCLKFVLSYTISLLLVVLIIYLELLIEFADQNLFFDIVFFIMAILVFVLWIPFYFSQMDMYTKNLTHSKIIWTISDFNFVSLKRGKLTILVSIVYVFPFVIVLFFSEKFTIISFFTVMIIIIMGMFCRFEKINTTTKNSENSMSNATDIL